MSVTGSLKTWMEGKGFGFIARDDGQGDVFVHPRNLTNGGVEVMIVGAKFAFDVEPDEKSGKNKAVNVVLTQPGSGAPPSGGKGGGFGGQPQREKCGDFLAGKCTRGDRCKYSYDDGRGGFGGAQPQQDNRYSPYGGAPAGYGAPQPAYGGGYGGPPALPPGWEQITDPSSGRPYFCNRQTGQSSWEPPAAAPAGPPPLPYGWEQVTDPSSGKPYFCNRQTGQSSWEPPRA